MPNPPLSEISRNPPIVRHVSFGRWITIQLNLAGPLMHVGGSIALEVRHVFGLRVVDFFSSCR